MPVIGIDYNTCSECGTCLRACPRDLYKDHSQDKIIFEDLKRMCTKCGQCIAQCPEDAILYENMGEAYVYEGINNPGNIINYEDMFKFLRAHRSIRRYKKEKVPVEILRKVFNAMQYAPTGRNMRSESFSILSDDNAIKNLNDAVLEELLKNELMRSMYEVSFTKYEKEYNSLVYFDAPHVIFVYSQLNIEAGAHNIANIITYGRLAAHTLGLGTCWNAMTQIAMELNPKLMKLAGIRGKKVGVFTIGYPTVTYYRTSPRFIKHVKGLE